MTENVGPVSTECTAHSPQDTKGLTRSTGGPHDSEATEQLCMRKCKAHASLCRSNASLCKGSAVIKAVNLQLREALARRTPSSLYDRACSEVESMTSKWFYHDEMAFEYYDTGFVEKPVFVEKRCRLLRNYPFC